MKSLTNYITEKMVYTKATASKYNYYPETKEELVKFIDKEISDNGFNCNLNCICTSEITDMSRLFDDCEEFSMSDKCNTKNRLAEFNGDISKWDVSNVKTMEKMFMYSKFNGDISKWDISNVEDMYGMFEFAYFNNDSISDWDISNVTYTDEMFWGCEIEEKYKPKRFK